MEQVVEWEDQKHGEIGRHVEKALQEYIDHGQTARIEEKVDEILSHVSDADAAHTHTRTGKPNSGSDTVEKCRDIHRRLSRNHDDPIPAPDVERAIEDIAGADPRTIAKYQGVLKKRCLLFKHPTSNVWATDRDTWAEWTESYINNDPTASMWDVVEDYGISVEEYSEMVDAVALKAEANDD